MIGWLFKAPFYLLGSVVRMTYSPRSRYYWHDHCEIHHRREDTRAKCASSAAYLKRQAEAIAREEAELAARAARRAQPVRYNDWAFFAGIAIPVLVVVVVLVLCMIA